jgi:hypothetical protein
VKHRKTDDLAGGRGYFDAGGDSDQGHKDTKAMPGPSKRVRVFLALDTPLADFPASLGSQGGDAP